MTLEWYRAIVGKADGTATALYCGKLLMSKGYSSYVMVLVALTKNIDEK